jgi:hypothetical protein
MNQHFSFSRWRMLVALHWAENRKRYGLALLAMGGLLCAWYGFIIGIDRFAPMDSFYQYSAYFAGLYFVGCLYASTIFSDLGNRAKGIQWLSIPASHLEKLLCALFFSVVLFFIAYTLIFYLVDIPMVKLASHIIIREHRVVPGTTQPIGEMEVFSIFGGNRLGIPDRDFYAFLLGFFAAQGAFILGSVYFTQYAFIKTTIAVLLMILVTVIFIMRVVQGNIPAGWRMDDLAGWIRVEGMDAPTGLVRLPLWIERTGFFLLRFSAPFIFWFITYFRLKEKEV